MARRKLANLTEDLMPGMDLLIERHRQLVEQFAHGHMSMPPKLGVIILTCVDPRVTLDKILGLELGDAFVLRNVGGRVTSDIEDDLAMIWYLMELASEPDIPALELAIIHHTNCGMEKMADTDVQEAVVAAQGLDPQAVRRRAIVSQEQSIGDDLQRLADSPKIPDQLVVSGYVYDVTTGKLRQVAEPQSIVRLRE